MEWDRSTPRTWNSIFQVNEDFDSISPVPSIPITRARPAMTAITKENRKFAKHGKCAFYENNRIAIRAVLFIKIILYFRHINNVVALSKVRTLPIWCSLRQTRNKLCWRSLAKLASEIHLRKDNHQTGAHHPRGDSQVKITGVLVGNFWKEPPRSTKIRFYGGALEFISTPRDVDSYITHYFVSIFLRPNTLKGTPKAPAVDLLRLNILRGTGRWWARAGAGGSCSHKNDAFYPLEVPSFLYGSTPPPTPPPLPSPSPLYKLKLRYNCQSIVGDWTWRRLVCRHVHLTNLILFVIYRCTLMCTASDLFRVKSLKIDRSAVSQA